MCAVGQGVWRVEDNVLAFRQAPSISMVMRQQEPSHSIPEQNTRSDLTEVLRVVGVAAVIYRHAL